MIAHPEIGRPSALPAWLSSLSRHSSAGTCIPAWERIPQDKRQELTQVLADMLIHKLQSLETEGAHDPPS